MSERNSALPVGGTTGLCHLASPKVDEAAMWFSAHRETCERPVIPNLRARFGLTPLEAVQAIREANQRLSQ